MMVQMQAPVARGPAPVMVPAGTVAVPDHQYTMAMPPQAVMYPHPQQQQQAMYMHPQQQPVYGYNMQQQQPVMHAAPAPVYPSVYPVPQRAQASAPSPSQ